MNIEIDNILLKLRQTVLNLNDTTLEMHKNSLKIEISKANENLNERFDEIYKEIELGTLDFERKFNLIKQISSISVLDIAEAYDGIFFTKPKKLSIQLYGRNKEIPTNKIENYNLNKTIITKIYDHFNFFRMGRAHVEPWPASSIHTALLDG